MKRAIALLTMAIVGCFASADDAPAKKVEWKKPDAPIMPATGTPKEKIEALIKQHDEQFAAYSKARSAAKSRQEDAAIRKEAPDREKFVELVFQIVEENPKDESALDSLIWVVRRGRQPEAGDGGDLPVAKALAMVRRDFLSHADIAKFCRVIQYHELSQDAEAICRSVSANHENEQTRAWATLALSAQMRHNAALAERVQKASEKVRAHYAKLFGDEVVARLAKEGSVAAYLKEADELLERIVATPAFAETPIPNRDSYTLGELAASTLFRMRNLVPGKPIPEIVGTDLDGETIKLSDYRGKVIVVNFWGTWCGPCMAQVPEEKKLVTEFEGRPFVLLGVNCDHDIKQSKKIVARDGINWKSIFDGAPGDGPIQRKFGIESYPTGFVIDHNGIIVGEFEPDKKTKKLIEEKVAEAEKANGSRASAE